jgi:hypothetical protein
MSATEPRATDCHGADDNEFAELVDRIARALVNEGISADSRIAVVGAATDEPPAVHHAAELVGATSVLCPASDSPERLAEFVIQVGADTVVVFPDSAEQAWLAVRSPQVRRVFGWGQVPGTDVDLAAAAERESGEPFPAAAVAGDQPMTTGSSATATVPCGSRDWTRSAPPAASSLTRRDARPM